MAETWYRGTTTKPPPTVAGAAVGGHDLGDGMYYTDTLSVAKTYAEIRAKNIGGTAMIVQVSVDTSALGKVLDLRSDQRWQSFLNGVAGGMRMRDLIRMANQNYAPLFQTFLSQHKLDLKPYDAVIAEEFVRGGYQMCILDKGGKPSAVADKLKAQWTAVPVPGGVATKVQYTMTGIVFKQNRDSRKFEAYMRKTMKRISNNQAGWLAFGEQLSKIAQAWGDHYIQKSIRARIESLEPYIDGAYGRGFGVLVFVQLQEWAAADAGGNRARQLLYVHAQEGSSPEDAMQRWGAKQQMLPAPREGWRYAEPTHIWVEGSSD